jgi:hypothetical protein
MPRKKTIKNDDVKIIKNNLIDTMFKNNENQNTEDHIILQLPLSQSRINSIINANDEISTIDPSPYESNSYFMNDAQNLNNNDIHEVHNTNNFVKSNSCCFWCCHPIDNITFGMPYNYNSINETYMTFGTFCSLQCANAYNFSVHSGSDKVWEINSLIQMLGKCYGYSNSIRPAPNRYMLKMFNGKLSIEEFRNAHINNEKTYILNIPPMISLSANSEILNTSYLAKITDIKTKNKK